MAKERKADVEVGAPGAVERGAQGPATLAVPAVRPSPPVRKPRKLPPFKVLLHNDDVSTFDHVIRSIVRIAALPVEEAVIKTIEAHQTGVSLLMVTHLERAELLVEQFASVNLTVTIEPQ